MFYYFLSSYNHQCFNILSHHRLDRTPEFQIYGHGQQRKAVIEALRLMEDGRKKGQELGHKLDEFSSSDLARSFKEKSKKWQKFVTQVHFLHP